MSERSKIASILFAAFLIVFVPILMGAWFQPGEAVLVYRNGPHYLLTDPKTQALVMVTHEENSKHEGESFTYSWGDLDLDSGNTNILAFKTPATGDKIHVFCVVGNTVASIFQIHEAPTITAGTGVTEVPINDNYGSAEPSATMDIDGIASNLISVNPTQTGAGTVKYTEVYGGTRNIGSTALVGRGFGERILAPDTVYSFVLTGNADNGVASMKISWINHTDAN